MIQKTIQIGTSIGGVFPKNLTKQAGINAGDPVFVTYNPQTRGITFTPQTPAPETHQEKTARLTLDFINRYRTDLEKLATE